METSDDAESPESAKSGDEMTVPMAGSGDIEMQSVVTASSEHKEEEPEDGVQLVFAEDHKEEEQKEEAPENSMSGLVNEMLSEETPQGPTAGATLSPTAASAGHSLLAKRGKSAESREPSADAPIATPNGVTPGGPTAGGPTAGGPDEPEPEKEPEPDTEPEPEDEPEPEPELEEEPALTVNISDTPVKPVLTEEDLATPKAEEAVE